MANAWIEHLKKVKEQNKDKNLKECMQIAKQTYNKKK